jgi:hypothetical protein
MEVGFMHIAEHSTDMLTLKSNQRYLGFRKIQEFEHHQSVYQAPT